MCNKGVDHVYVTWNACEAGRDGGDEGAGVNVRCSRFVPEKSELVAISCVNR